LALAQKLQGGLPHSWRTGTAWLIQGRILAQQGDLPRAREAYEAALRHLSDTVDPAHPALRQVQSLLTRA
jgi:predicted negative regulator of RcsB-dependent stress response